MTTQLLITRPRKDATTFALLARQAGFEPVLFPTIDIRPVDDTTALERAIAKLKCYDWLVFTSAKAVDIVLDLLASKTTASLGATPPASVELSPEPWPDRSAGEAKEERRRSEGLSKPRQTPFGMLRASSFGFAQANTPPADAAQRDWASLGTHGRRAVTTRNGSTPRIAAVGAKTAATLQQRGVVPDFVPERFRAEEILPGLGDLRGRWVLLPTADIGRDTLPRAIVAADGVAHVVTVYHTLPAVPDPRGLDALRAGVDWLTFTSPSTARNFIALVQQAGLNPFDLPGNPRVACIGPVTAAAARELGFRVDAIADPYTVEGLLAAIQSAN